MIPRVVFAFWGCMLAAPPTAAQEAERPAETIVPEDTTINQWRSPVDALPEKMLGTSSRSVRFEWRKSPFAVAVFGSELLERNNFGSTRSGLLLRKAVGSFMADVAVSRVWSWGTDSSGKLALTPYRQFGRPSRFEVDVDVGYAVAEGVVTPVLAFVPAAEMVFSVNLGFRYLVYPESFANLKLEEIAQAVVAPQLLTPEIDNLEKVRLPGMQVDPARYGLMGGMSMDVYFQPGVFVTPRAMVALPVLSPINATGLGLWWELTLAVGWAL